MTKKYKLAVIIGRFQPLHEGHLQNILSAFENHAGYVQICIGSSFQPRTPKNPFTFSERKEMIDHYVRWCEPGFSPYYKVSPLRDYKYNDMQWIAQVQQVVKDNWKDIEDKDICIVGYDKDDSSWYNHTFPAWDFVPMEPFTKNGEVPVDATKIRELYFEGHFGFIENLVADHDFMNRFAKTPEYRELVNEYNYLKEYKKSWAAAPYPPTFMCTDAVVVQGGHILLIQRKIAPGKGLWALPGGFLNQKERAFNGCIRELVEETRIKVPEVVMRKSLVHQELFDDPNRSLRGRTLTQAFLFKLDGGDGKLPKVKPRDDAKDAQWVKLGDLQGMSEVMFEDHLHIINTMLGRVKQ